MAGPSGLGFLRDFRKLGFTSRARGDESPAAENLHHLTLCLDLTILGKAAIV